MSQNPFDDNSTLDRVKFWCRQATNHFLSKCRHRSTRHMALLGHSELIKSAILFYQLRKLLFIYTGKLQAMLKSHKHSLFPDSVNSTHYKACFIHAIALTTKRYLTCFGATLGKAPRHSKISAVNILWHRPTTKILCIRQHTLRHCDVHEVSPWQTLFTSIGNTNVSKKFTAFCASFAIFGCSPNRIIKHCWKANYSNIHDM